jgi:DNA-directed RNA polymerase subunit K/omega
MGLKPLDLKKIQEIAGNTYEAIVIMAKRARQVNDERKIMFNKRLDEVRALKAQQQQGKEEEPVRILDDEKTPKAPPEQLQIAEEFDQMPKPADVAIEEYLSGKLEWSYSRDKDEERRRK